MKMYSYQWETETKAFITQKLKICELSKQCKNYIDFYLDSAYWLAKSDACVLAFKLIVVLSFT